MRILISQNDRKTGPHSPEELRDLVYRGEIQRSALAQVEGESDWVSVDTLLTRPASRPAVVVPPKIVLPFEQRAIPKSARRCSGYTLLPPRRGCCSGPGAC